MKKTILLALVGITTSIMASNTILSDAKLSEIKKGTLMLQNPALKISKGMELENTYFLQLEAKGPGNKPKLIEGFLDKKTGDLYLGGGYDKSGKKYSFPLNKAAADEAVAFSYGSGNKEIYIFTDPECPYCIKFAKDSQGKLKDYKVNVVLMPLSNHKNAKAMTSYIISGKDNAEKTKRYHDVAAKGSKDYGKSKINTKVLNKYLAKSKKASQELGVRGTPSFFKVEGDSLKKIQWGDIIEFKKPVQKTSFDVNLKDIKKSVALSYGTGKKNVYLITDPECPYCIKFAKGTEGKLKGYTVNVVFMPLGFHKEAKPMVSYIISGKNNAEKAKRYHDIVLNNDKSYKKSKVNNKKLNSYLVESQKTVKTLGVRGTPSFFVESKDGKKLNIIGWGDLLK